MKKVLFCILISIVCLKTYSQIQAVPMESYCFGNLEHNFMSKLSQESKSVFEQIIKRKNIDTCSLYRVTYHEIFTKYGLKSYLSKHTYTYIVWSKDERKTTINEKISLNSYNSQPPNKLIVIYTTNNKDIEDLSVYLVN